jgi:hypothetical protein
MFSYKALIRSELEKASLYRTLACYYEYRNRQLHECYNEKHYACVEKLAELIRNFGDPFSEEPAPGHQPGKLRPLGI